MKRLKNLIEKVVIFIVVFMLIMSTFGSGVVSAYNSSEIGSAVAGYTLNLLTWGNEENLPDGGPKLRYSQGDRNNHPTYKNSDVALPWYYDCSSFACAMFNIVCGEDVTGGELTSASMITCGKFVEVSTPQPGDIRIKSGHVEIYISDELGTGGAHSNGSKNSAGKTTNANQVDCAAISRGFKSISPEDGKWMRLKSSITDNVTDLNTDFTITGVGTSVTSGTSLTYSDFFFNGIPDGKYAISSTSLWQVLVDTYLNIMSFIIGIVLYILRITWMGFVSTIYSSVNNAIYSIYTQYTTLEDSGLTATKVDDPTSENTNVTIESIVFNQLDIFDVDFFSAT
jgi:hypothetical protein